jgi:hypothetical protein
MPFTTTHAVTSRRRARLTGGRLLFVKGAIIGVLSGSVLSLPLSCAALGWRPGILEP